MEKKEFIVRLNSAKQVEVMKVYLDSINEPTETLIENHRRFNQGYEYLSYSCANMSWKMYDSTVLGAANTTLVPLQQLFDFFELLGRDMYEVNSLKRPEELSVIIKNQKEMNDVRAFRKDTDFINQDLYHICRQNVDRNHGIHEKICAYIAHHQNRNHFSYDVEETVKRKNMYTLIQYEDFARVYGIPSYILTEDSYIITEGDEFYVIKSQNDGYSWNLNLEPYIYPKHFAVDSDADYKYFKDVIKAKRYVDNVDVSRIF